MIDGTRIGSLLAAEGYEAAGTGGYAKTLSDLGQSVRVSVPDPARVPAAALRVAKAALQVEALDSAGHRLFPSLYVEEGEGLAERTARRASFVEALLRQRVSMACPACGSSMRIKVQVRTREPFFTCADSGCGGTRPAEEATSGDPRHLALLRRLAGQGADPGPACRCGSLMVQRVDAADGGRFWGCSRFPRCPWTCRTNPETWEKWNGGTYWEGDRWWKPRSPLSEWNRVFEPLGFAYRPSPTYRAYVKELRDQGMELWCMEPLRGYGGEVGQWVIDVGVEKGAGPVGATLVLPGEADRDSRIQEHLRRIEAVASLAGTRRCPACAGPMEMDLDEKTAAPHLRCVAQPACGGHRTAAELLGTGQPAVAGRRHAEESRPARLWATRLAARTNSRKDDAS